MQNQLDKQAITSVNTVETTEYSLASTLLCLKFPLEEIRSTPPQTIWVFRFSEELEQTIDAFWAGALLVEPKTLHQACRELKSRMRSTILRKV